MTHQDLDTPVLKLVNHQRMMRKDVTKVRILNPLVITVTRKDILPMFAGAEGSISKAYLREKGTVTSATCKDI